MSGETNLRTLIEEMSPVLDQEEYVFATTAASSAYAHIPVIMRFVEDEGETLILKAADAKELDLQISEIYARITLNVHSSLAAVGFLAAMCSALAKHGISTNAVSGFYHDHIFVPQSRACDAMQILTGLSESQL